jgi:hypothetical protein
MGGVVETGAVALAALLVEDDAFAGSCANAGATAN